MPNNIKFLLLIKRDSDLRSKIDQIKDIIYIHKPHILVLTELQMHKYDNVSKKQFPGYSLEGDKLDKTDIWSHTGVLIKNSLNYKRRKDLEGEGTLTVWLQLGAPGTKQILPQAIYCQFCRQGRNGSNSQSAQLARWKQVISKCETALTEVREIVSMGDINIDSLEWEKKWEEMKPYDRQKQTMYKLLRETILATGTTEINSEFTREDSQPGGRRSCIDHLYYTHPEKVNSFNTYHDTFSDHMMVELNIKI